MATDYIWPLSNSTRPDEMNTSFGPRINNKEWDFHDGIDSPGEEGVTKVHAMRVGTVHLAGPGDDRFSSRHVVLKVDDPNDGLMYLVYLHLARIDLAVTPDASVAQGQLIGTVGEDGATHPHLHFEFRKGTLREISSVHPLGYLPYTDTPNFSPPVPDRFNRLGSLMAARLLFGAISRLEGDLKRVEVDLKSGATLLERHFVDFDNKKTVNEGNSDEKMFKKDIGVEGYQQSPMNDPKRLRKDLKYGILVRNIPSDCNTLIARVIDVGSNIATSAEIAVPDQVAVDEFVDFEDGAMPPAGWKPVTSMTGSGTTVTNDTSAAYSGSRGMRCVDDSTTETNTQRAGIEFTLPAGRFEWIAEGWFNPVELHLEQDQSIQLLRFLSGEDLSVAARIICREGGLQLAGIVAKEPDGTFPPRGQWRRHRSRLAQVATASASDRHPGDDRGSLLGRGWPDGGASPAQLGFDGLRAYKFTGRHWIVVGGSQSDRARR